MLNQLRAMLAISLLALSLQARADLVVIVNAHNEVEQITRTDVINIFLGNNREFSNGLSAMPVDLPAALPEKALFYRTLVNKDLDQLAAYWSRLVFAGNTSPPALAASMHEALRVVASNRSAIAYIDRKYVDAARVKIVYSFP
jgi:ABC-type phosphate transport system substrate-binding protein